MKLLYEISAEGRALSLLPKLDVPRAELPENLRRTSPARLPQLSEIDLSRHYTALSKRTHGVNDGFYPLGSCTMKYNARVNEEAAALPGFSRVHPLQPVHTVQGSLRLLTDAETMLCEITGMDRMSFQPAAGAHGELLGLLLIKAYHKHHGNVGRNKIIVPDSAHGTNPASAAMVGYQVISVPSNAEGGVDLDALRAAVGEDTAGLMLTNPNTLGVFDKNILEITQIVHEAGGLNYYDGANLNAIMGVARPGDMGFDVVHLNLHKTFGTPHGGGGPGAGPVGVKDCLVPFLPAHQPIKLDDGYAFEDAAHTIGTVKSFYGNFLVVVRALCYILTLGREGIPEAAENAVLNSNYMMHLIKDIYPMATDGICMHEFVMALEPLKKQTGVSAMDIAKGLLDRGIHPPTMYFPLIVHEALMVEPTETESKSTLEQAADVLRELHKLAHDDPESLHQAPIHTPVRRLDEVGAARNPRLRYAFPEG
ncbi:aminomethyl-transferring glycine dehydrogenase subunit GcvPB [Eubacteriales bacterium OttesenSCG-928-N13]|nr:aminomethyl-transferring glycine dehydrogenase subunit GcvPB [Eubacteriales bacterium OttesenSCG-928-N13]